MWNATDYINKRQTISISRVSCAVIVFTDAKQIQTNVAISKIILGSPNDKLF